MTLFLARYGTYAGCKGRLGGHGPQSQSRGARTAPDAVRCLCLSVRLAVTSRRYKLQTGSCKKYHTITCRLGKILQDNPQQAHGHQLSTGGVGYKNGHFQQIIEISQIYT